MEASQRAYVMALAVIPLVAAATTLPAMLLSDALSLPHNIEQAIPSLWPVGMGLVAAAAVLWNRTSKVKSLGLGAAAAGIAYAVFLLGLGIYWYSTGIPVS